MTTTTKKESILLDASIVRVGDYTVGIDKLTINPSMSIRDISESDIDDCMQELESSHVSQVIDVIKTGESLIVINGIRSVMALKKLKEDGVIVDPVVSVHEVNGSDLAVIMHMVNAPGESELTPLEMSKAYCRVASLGIKQCDIAKLFNVTSVQVSNYILLADIPPSLQELIKDGVISPTKAHQSIRKNGIEETMGLVITMIGGRPKKAPKKAQKQRVISLPSMTSKKVCSTTQSVAEAISKVGVNGEDDVKIKIPASLAKAIQSAARVA
ncbi:hypothetical protein LMH73_008700 [Vibrio splendidus]|nr:hypothetical protein [Vibrio splendidus]MCC4879454.1 hypothetical protein [Vibrio splendidus]